MTSRFRHTLKLTGTSLVFLGLLIPAYLWAAPSSVSLATHAVGSLYNAQGTAMSVVISKHSPMVVRVRPFAGPPAWIPDMESGEIEFGVVTGTDAATAYQGILLYKRKYPSLRLVMSGGVLRVGFIVKKNTGIKNVSELKGKKIPVDFPGTPISRMGSTAGLASANMTSGDMVKVPVADLGGNVQAFMEGRTDAMWYSVGGPAVQEADSRLSGGVRFISLVNTPEANEKVGKIIPGGYISPVKGGSAPGVVEDTQLLTLDIYIIAPKDLPEDVVTRFVKTLWDYNAELTSSPAPLIQEWSRERMVTPYAAIPYHTAAIKFFREKGMWTREMEAVQQKLLAGQ